MKLLYAITGTAALAGTLLPTSCKRNQARRAADGTRFNIVYIMCDDHSYQTVSAYDRRYMETPNIDRLAEEGNRFTNSFVANSLSGRRRCRVRCW